VSREPDPQQDYADAVVAQVRQELAYWSQTDRRESPIRIIDVQIESSPQGSPSIAIRFTHKNLRGTVFGFSMTAVDEGPRREWLDPAAFGSVVVTNFEEFLDTESLPSREPGDEGVVWIHR
jgi:hypothetical protein